MHCRQTQGVWCRGTEERAEKTLRGARVVIASYVGSHQYIVSVDRSRDGYHIHMRQWIGQHMVVENDQVVVARFSLTSANFPRPADRPSADLEHVSGIYTLQGSRLHVPGFFG